MHRLLHLSKNGWQTQIHWWGWKLQNAAQLAKERSLEGELRARDESTKESNTANIFIPRLCTQTPNDVVGWKWGQMDRENNPPQHNSQLPDTLERLLWVGLGVKIAPKLTLKWNYEIFPTTHCCSPDSQKNSHSIFQLAFSPLHFAKTSEKSWERVWKFSNLHSIVFIEFPLSTKTVFKVPKKHIYITWKHDTDFISSSKTEFLTSKYLWDDFLGLACLLFILRKKVKKIYNFS